MGVRFTDKGSGRDIDVHGWGGANPALALTAFADHPAGGGAETTSIVLHTRAATTDSFDLVGDANHFRLRAGQNVKPQAVVARTVFDYDYGNDLLTLGRPLVAQSVMQVSEVVFTETVNSGVYTGSVTLPAGSTLLDVRIRSTVLWAASTAARLDVGDASLQSGWFSTINLVATDLPVGDEINFQQQNGKGGVYLTTTARSRTQAYNAAAYTVLCKVTTTDSGSGATGSTRVLVMYTTPTVVTAVKV